MRWILNKTLLNRCIYFSCKDNRRYAGHSKWQNIKHIKEANDNERMVLFHHLKLKMRIAIALGGNAKPENNVQLAQVIERAKKANMPVASIKTFLEKMEARKNKTQEGMIEIRGPNGYIMLVRYITDNTKALQITLNTLVRKCSVQYTNSAARNMFDHIGRIVVEKKGTLEQATEDAINVDAEDVEEFEENNVKYFQFICDPTQLKKVHNLLERHQYSVLLAEEDYIPKNVVKLSDSDMETVTNIRNKFLSVEDISHIYDNVE